MADERRRPLVGDRLGGYTIESLLGVGGMGEVYRARDSKLGRLVAIKVLPPTFATDAERVDRFSREARLLATLNHPNIATIHGFEELDGVQALVMELVDGPTLAEKLTRSKGAWPGLPPGEAITIATQIATALEAAHDKGIIHRDLKPANIKVDREGRVKVLDFGLAKAVIAGVSEGTVSNEPTMIATAAVHGAVIGTPAYMSPEQARGELVDTRTDIWAFGCVLFELLTGQSAFARATMSETLAAVLEHEPDWERVPTHTPSQIRRLLRRCLQKDPKQRLRDIGDARLECEEVRSGVRDDGAAPPTVGRRPQAMWPWLLVPVAAAGAAAIAWTFTPVPATREIRLEINTPPSRDSAVAISPDGLTVVFASRSDNVSRLWLRSLDAATARPLPRTEGAILPFWSPDGRSIGFFSQGGLKRLDLADGSVTTLIPISASPLFGGGTWGEDGTIVVGRNPGSPLARVPADGGELVPVTRLESPQHRWHSSPRFLPGGRHFLFFVTGNAERRGVYLGQTDNLEAKRLFDAAGPAEYSSGHLFFVRERKLVAQPFDLRALDLTGTPQTVLEPVGPSTSISVSATGTIVSRTTTGDSGQRQFLWVDRSGRQLDSVVYDDTAALGPALSRNAKQVAVFRYVNGNIDIWSYDIGRRAWNRLTSYAGDDIYPLWSPDGNSLIYASGRGGVANLFQTELNGASDNETEVLATSQAKFPMDWSADGRFLLFDVISTGQSDQFVLALDGSGKTFGVATSEFNERLGQFSPDGKWVAYQSDKTGRFEIYLRPFPGGGSEIPVSSEGGAQPRWNSNGQELFYIAADDNLMSVPIRRDASGVTLQPGPPTTMFATTVGSRAPNTNRHQYAVAPGGQSFLMNTVPDSVDSAPITVILNWKPKP